MVNPSQFKSFYRKMVWKIYVTETVREIVEELVSCVERVVHAVAVERLRPKPAPSPAVPKGGCR